MSDPSPEYLAQSKVLDLKICYSVPIPLEILSTSLRLWAELRPGRNGLAFDDLLMVWATAVSVGLCISGLVYGPPYGMGRHIGAVDEEDVKTFMLGDYIFSHFYDFAIASTKLSVLALYHRIFPKPVLRRIVIFTAIFVVLWLMTMELVLGFQCRPIQRFWDQDVDGDCFNLVAFSYFTNITNLVTDLWILVLPLPIILRLQVSRSKKIRLSLLFSVGLAYIIHSYGTESPRLIKPGHALSAPRASQLSSRRALRTLRVSPTLLGLQNDPDIAGAGVPLGILSVWEPLGGILCANLPISHKLFSGAFRKVTGRTSSERNRLSPTGPRSWYHLKNLPYRKANRNLEATTDTYYTTHSDMNSAEMGGIVVQRSIKQVSSYMDVDPLRQGEEMGVPSEGSETR
ncbi:hypothetical protein BDW72DRAFT_211229 [Aspergillus terricola var. indicus]